MDKNRQQWGQYKLLQNKDDKAVAVLVFLINRNHVIYLPCLVFILTHQDSRYTHLSISCLSSTTMEIHVILHTFDPTKV